MSKGLQEALGVLRSVGGVDELRGLAEVGLAPLARPGVNSHIHLPPNFSAFETVGQAVELAQAQGVALLGVTNYYDYEVYGEFASQAIRRGVFPLFGLEIVSLIAGLQAGGIRGGCIFVARVLLALRLRRSGRLSWWSESAETTPSAWPR